MTITDILTMTQAELRDYLASLNSPFYDKYVYDGGILFIPRDVTSYALICAHTDTINDATRMPPPSREDILEAGDYLSLSKGSPCSCLGGDDRCGVYIALKLIAKGLPYAFGFFKDEEVGCIGSKALSSIIETFDITCFIGVDRKGFNELALYGHDNKELIDIFKGFGYEVEYGSITDASKLASLSLKGLACLNLSIGYWNEHTTAEFIITTATERTLEYLSDYQLAQRLGDKPYLDEGDSMGSSYYGGFGRYTADPYYCPLDDDDYYPDEWDEMSKENEDYLEPDNSFDYDANSAEIKRAFKRTTLE